MTYASEVLADSPLRYYKLDDVSGGPVDSSTNATNGSMAGTPTYGVASVVGTGILNNGTDSYISTNAAISGMASVWSLEFWYKYAGSTTGNVLWRDDTTTGGWLMLFSSSDANLTFRALGTDRVITGAGTTLKGSGPRGDGWHHVVMTSTANVFTTYIDGTSVDAWTRGSVANGSSVNQPIRFGRNGGGAGLYVGTYDEIAVYGTTLSGARVAAHYAATGSEVSAALTGSGAFSAVVVPVVAVAAALAGSGAFTAASVEVEQTAASLTGAGAFSAAAFPSHDRNAALGGSGAFSAAVETNNAVNANLTGSGAFTAAAFGSLSVAADLAGAGVFAAIAFPSLTVTADLTGSGVFTAEVENASAPELDAALTGSGVFSAVVQIGGATYTDTSNADDGILLDGTAEVVWEPDVVPIPAVFGPMPLQARTVGRVIVTAPTYQPFAAATVADSFTTRLRERVLIGDRDWTFLRDTPLRIDNLRFIDPLLYGSGALTIPQVNPQYDENITLDADGLPYGVGDLAGLERLARVVVQLVDEDDVIVVPDYYKGFVSKINADGHVLSVELGGQASGRLSAMYVTPPVYRRKQDVEHILVDTLRDARVRAHEHDGASGIGLIRRGGSDGLSIFNEVLAVWAGATETPITFTPNADGFYRKQNKDTESIDFTAYIDSDLVTQSLSQDFMEQYTRVYATGRTAAGELVSFVRTPGLTQQDPPAFPGLLEVGDTDDSDGYVTAVQSQLTISNYLDYADVTPGVFDEEMAEAVRELQADAGLLVTAIGAGQDGKVNEPTWDAMWNLEAIGYSLDDARQYPAAQDPRTSKWNRTANGSKLSLNDDYDPHLIPVDGFIDTGGPHGERQTKRYAKSKLSPRGGVWNGTLTLKSGLIRGEHNPGDPFDAADVADRREVMPNHRIWLPRFMGGIVVTVTGSDNTSDETQLLVSTLPLTTMETWTAIERAREAESNPGNTWSGHVRKSQIRNDTVVEWDTSSGYIANKRPLVVGWNEIKVPAGQTGIVKDIELQLQDPDEFAALLTQKPVALDALNTRIDPLTAPTGRPWYERETIIDWLDERGKLEAWGTYRQPCGYDPSRKEDENGPTAEPITGLFVEEAGFNYETGVEPVLFLYVWVGSDNFLMPGRVLRNQRTSGY